MVTVTQPISQKMVRTLILTIVLFVIMAASAVGYALSRDTVFLYPLAIFGLSCLISLAFYVQQVVKNARDEVREEKSPKKDKPKRTDPLGAKA
jgi:hypothetical protein